MEKLGVDIKLLIAQITNFILFFIVFKKLVSKPFKNFLDNERKKEELKEKLDSAIKEFEVKKQSDEKNFKEKFEKEKQKIIKETREEAEKKRTEMLNETEEEIGRLKTKTKEELEKSRQIMEKQLKKDIVTLGIEIVRTGFKNYLTPQTMKELTATMIKNAVKEN